MLQNELKSALRSLSLRPLQTFLSALGIIIGVAAVVAMLAIGAGAKKKAMEEIAQMGLYNLLIESPHRSAPLYLSDATHIENSLPGVEEVLPVRRASLSTGEEYLPVITTTEAAAPLFHLQLSSGRFLSAIDVEQKKAVCVLGAELAKEIGPAAQVGGDLILSRTPFRIVGILDAQAAAPLIGSAADSAWLPLGVGTKNSLSNIVVHLNKGADLPLAKQQVERLLEWRHPNSVYSVTIPVEAIRQSKKMERTFTIVLTAVALISLIVGGIGVTNIMLATVSTRTREIGIRRALGATRADIVRQFLSETLVLNLGGALIGLLLGVTVAGLVGRAGEWEAAITLGSCLLALMVSVVVGLLSGLTPAIKASKLSPAAALRSN